MITFPVEFAATMHPGYFWNVMEQRLYSMKTSGVLKAMKHQSPNRWNNGLSGYRISVNGRRRWLDDKYLRQLSATTDSVIPVDRSV